MQKKEFQRSYLELPHTNTVETEFGVKWKPYNFHGYENAFKSSTFSFYKLYFFKQVNLLNYSMYSFAPKIVREITIWMFTSW